MNVQIHFSVPLSNNVKSERALYKSCLSLVILEVRLEILSSDYFLLLCLIDKIVKYFFARVTFYQ